MSQTQKFSGWGRYPVVKGQPVRPEQLDAIQEMAKVPATSSRGSLLARGAGRSYGDAALPEKGERVVLTERLDRMIAFDPETGVLRAEAGVRLRDILATFVSRGWFLPVTPGTKEVTLGGAVAFDVHGKNHHCDGGISNFVRRLTLLTAQGEHITCSPDARPDLFWATVSGAGLTGIITEVELTLRPIETSYIAQRTVKARDLEDAFALFETHEADYPYSVAWIDCLAGGSKLGRSHLMFGRHATLDQLEAKKRSSPLTYTPDHLASLPFNLPKGLLNATTVRAFNALNYARQRQRDVRSIVGIDPFFYPLDAIADWNRMYGKPGFTQFQCVLPLANSYDGLVRILEQLRASGRASFLAVLKRMGPRDGGLLTFPMRGYTLALDIPRRDGLPALMRRLHDIVLRYDGRVYLAKDAYLDPESFRAMYPNYQDWRSIKERIDSENRFRSALSRRLKITP